MRRKMSLAAEEVSESEIARSVLKEMLLRGPVSLDEIGRRMGHTRGYMSRALRGTNPLTLETIVGALKLAGLQPGDYFAAVGKALAPEETEDRGPTQDKIEEVVLRTLRRLGWLAPSGDERTSKTPAR